MYIFCAIKVFISIARLKKVICCQVKNVIGDYHEIGLELNATFKMLWNLGLRKNLDVKTLLWTFYTFYNFTVDRQ